MNETTLILLLQLIKYNGSTETLIRMGYQYSQIAQLINGAIEEDYASYKDDFIQITEKGNLKLKELNKKFSRKNVEEWISPQEYYRCEKSGLLEVYLPDIF